MKLTIHHLPDGTFAAEIPTGEEKPTVVFSSPYDSDAGRMDQYAVLSAVLLRLFRIVLPPVSETKLNEPGEDTVTAKIAG